MNRLPSFSEWKILPEIFHTLAFAETFTKVWDEFYPSKMEGLKNFLIDYAGKCSEADKADTKRWPNKKSYISVLNEINLYNCMARKANWIDENKNIRVITTGVDNMMGGEDVIDVEIFSLLGTKVENPGPGVYIRVSVHSDGSVSKEKIIVRQ
ncbi:MAG: hypothetical protein HDS52_09930 [Barnesiella sp.]|nr:hypothetical protein [Barnesiella sp.]